MPAVLRASSWLENAVSQAQGALGLAVPAVTLDELCRTYEIKNINFLKMNIEGAERHALFGMLSWLQTEDSVSGQ
jgi:FkbM family methyltransferase